MRVNLSNQAATNNNLNSQMAFIADKKQGGPIKDGQTIAATQSAPDMQGSLAV